MLVLDITSYMSMSEYHARYDGLVAMLKASGGHVLLPGEVRWEHYRDAMANGVEVDDAKWAALLHLGY